MIIHSVAPLHMLIDTPPAAQMQLRSVAGGYVEGEMTPEGFRTARLCSTDPRQYLRQEYFPGSVWSGK